MINLQPPPNLFFRKRELPRHFSFPFARILILSPSNAPRLKGDEGSTQSTATFLPSATNEPIKASVSVLFPAPGGPVIPITLLLLSGIIDKLN